MGSDNTSNGPLDAEIPLPTTAASSEAAAKVNGGASSSASSTTAVPIAKKRRTFALSWMPSLTKFTIPRQRLDAFVTPGRRMDAWCGLLHYCVEGFVYLLGPLLILLATSIIGLLVYTYFNIVLDMLGLYYAGTWYGPYILKAHTAFVIFLFVNVVQNYYKCVMTSNMKGPSYDRVMREMALATGFVFPESPQEVDQFRKDYEDRMVLRMQCRRHRAQEAARKLQEQQQQQINQDSNGNNMTHRKNAQQPATPPPPPMPPRAWMLLGPHEWGFCNQTNQPKPPRSHFCHVSKGLVFCLDHYCPWMFNSVGYFNYRYFTNFLIFACVSMLYGASLTYTPFMLLSTTQYRDQLRMNRHHMKVSHDRIPLPRMEPFLARTEEKMYITLCFMLCLAVGLAVGMLAVFHIYLTLTCQTTIEFHGNYSNARRARRLGKKWKNPYDLGVKRNFQQVYGSKLHPLLAIIIPSSREPEFLPVPLPGDQGKRSTYSTDKTIKDGGDSNHHQSNGRKTGETLV